MKEKVILFCFLIFGVQYANALACSCGSYETGTYDYFTNGNSDCCSRDFLAGASSTYSTWIQGPGRTWILHEMKDVSYSVIMNECCPSS